MQCSAEDIVIHNWAELIQTPDQKWRRLWDIKLKKTIPETIDFKSVSQALSHEDFQVYVEVSDGNHVKVSVTTDRWGWEDDLYFATYRMFQEIDHIFGTIDTIQGQDRDFWPPWQFGWWNSRDD